MRSLPFESQAPGRRVRAPRRRRLAVPVRGTEEVNKKMAEAKKADLKAADPKEAKAKDAALNAALSPDREAVRAGLGDEARRQAPRSRSRRSRPAPCRSTWRSGSAASRAGGSSRSSAPSRRARRRSSTTSSPRPRRAAGSARSSTPSTRSTRSTRSGSASTPTSCWSPSPTTASRRSRSSTC